VAESTQTYLKAGVGENADTLLLRRWPGAGEPVLYVHGATPLGRAPEAAFQIGAVINRIRRERGGAQVHIVAHSWGTIAAGLRG
jgi:esterase/lipase superfamily enzyme